MIQAIAVLMIVIGCASVCMRFVDEISKLLGERRRPPPGPLGAASQAAEWTTPTTAAQEEAAGGRPGKSFAAIWALTFIAWVFCLAFLGTGALLLLFVLVAWMLLVYPMTFMIIRTWIVNDRVVIWGATVAIAGLGLLLVCLL